MTFLSLFGQNKKYVDYEKDSRWFWTANAGVTWSSTDVKSKNDWGWGLTLGKSFNYNYGKLISFDIRGRYLKGDWYGQDNDTTGFKYTNKTLSSGNTNYKDSLGFSVNNFYAKTYEGSLELVLHANKLRERTGWDIYVFGGVGITAFKTSGNLLNSEDSLGAMYKYDELSGYSTSVLNGVLDKSYETNLDGSSSANFIFTPSLGFGIGYQVFPRFSMGLEHKTTFTQLDYYDGVNNPEGKYENDWYHYTSAYMRFHLKKRNPSNYVDEKEYDTQLPPEVIYTNPATSGTTVDNPNYSIQALVKNVNGRDNINFRQNGVFVSNFSYNASNDKLVSQVTLQPGQNVFEIIASNAYGTDQETTIIIYRQPQQVLPIVKFLNPASNPHTTSNPGFNLSASVLNVQSASQVSMLVNGQQFSNFNFDPASGNLNSVLNLTVGTNVVTITGTNSAGSDTETTTIIYNPVQNIQLPVVYFVDPSQSPITVLTQSYLINADVLNVDGRGNITFKQNGNSNQNFTYNANSDDFQSSVILVPGQNVFEIIATNAAGSAQATTIIIYERAAPKPPVVTITNPSVSPYNTENALFNLSATVLNVTTQSQVKVTLNGQNNANFVFNPSNGNVSLMLNLIEGTNTAVVTGTNNDGTDSKQVVLIYKKPNVVQPPLVTFTNPSISPYNTNTSSLMITATVLNVESGSNINVNVNGMNYTGFTYNTSTKVVSFNQNLMEGANTVVITGTNTAGVDSKSTTIIYKKTEVILPPVVTFIDPILNPLTVFNPSYALKAKILNITSNQNIKLKINGIISTAFTYSSTTKSMEFSSALLNGANIFEITATNTAGQDSKSTTIIYKQSEPLLPPVVMFTSPLISPYTTNSATTPIEATVLNVENQQNISVTVNGVLFSGFAYNDGTKKVSFTMSLNEGSNTVLIQASNTAGQASDTRTIIYKKEVVVKPPFVTFINPSQTGLTVNNANYTVKATIVNIENANQAVLSQNGLVVNPALYSYNAATKELSFNTALSLGNNIFMIQATNTGGTHSATTSIIYKLEEKPCDKPVVTFLLPNASGQEIAQSNNAVKLKIQNVTNANQVTVLLNGVVQNTGTFNPSGQIFDLNVNYTLGQNILEVIVKNACGETKETTVVTYKPAGEPCKTPGIKLIYPTNIVSTVDLNEVEVRMGVLNVKNTADMIFKVNGVVKTFTYDQAQHILISNVVLVDGLNTVSLQTSNDCGSANLDVKITKKVCVKPTVTISNSSVQNNGSTIIESFSLDGNLQEIMNSTQFTITHNGNAINFIYNSVQKTFSLSTNLTMGTNTFVLKATNNCGEDVKEIKVTRIKDPNAVPPKVMITSPATTPFSTITGAFNVQATTQFVTAASQVSMTINGSYVNANFNLQNGSLTYNATLVEGNNVIVVSAANQYGSATDTKTIVYTRPVIVTKPLIVLINPASCPATLPLGNNVISGHILNITDLNQVSMTLNGVSVSNFNPVLANGKLNFQFSVNMSAQNNNLNLQINAQNQGGSDSKSCLLKIPYVDPTACIPTVGATFSADSKSVTTTSTKNLSNVVVKFADGTVQKFDGLSGLTGTFSGTGANAGKCIAGVWIKSGCNQSTDGPGYGQWVANSQDISRCKTPAEECKPLCGATFAADSKSVLCTSSKDLMNVVLKFYDGQEQQFSSLTGKSINLTGTGANAGKCISGVYIRSGCNVSNAGPEYGEWIANTKNLTNCTPSNGNNGHGNNTDGTDESNPGQGGGGPNGGTNGTTDDESGKGGGKTPTKTPTTPTKTPTTPVKTIPTTPVKTTPTIKPGTRTGGN